MCLWGGITFDPLLHFPLPFKRNLSFSSASKFFLFQYKLHLYTPSSQNNVRLIKKSLLFVTRNFLTFSVPLPCLRPYLLPPITLTQVMSMRLRRLWPFQSNHKVSMGSTRSPPKKSRYGWHTFNKCPNYMHCCQGKVLSVAQNVFFYAAYVWRKGMAVYQCPRVCASVCLFAIVFGGSAGIQITVVIL